MKKLFLFAVLAILFASPAFAQHTVIATWIASSDAAANPSLTYNLYRASAPCASATTFTKLNTAPITGTSFTDSSVTVGNSYCYEATAVLNGVESADSNTAQAVILPASPSTLTVKAN